MRSARSKMAFETPKNRGKKKKNETGAFGACAHSLRTRRSCISQKISRGLLGLHATLISSPNRDKLDLHSE